MKKQFWGFIFLVLFVAAAWLLLFRFSLVPVHSRNPIDIQTTSLE